MILRKGRINNAERKFIPIRKSKFNQYLDRLVFSESYKITQYYFGGYKFRKLEDNEIKYTKSKKAGDYTEVTEVTEEEFLKNFDETQVIVKFRTKYKDEQYNVEIDNFQKPMQMTIIEVSSDVSDLYEYVPDDTFIEVTENSIFTNENIINGSIKKSNIIIEGTDGVGKTTVVERLLEDGIICQDRCEDIISKNMLFDISMEKRAKEIYDNYFSNDQDTLVVFLINLDKEELESRIKKRGNISDFDLDTYKYGLLYKDTYEYIKSNYDTKGRFDIVDCSGLDKNEQYEKIKDLIQNLKQKEEE